MRLARDRQVVPALMFHSIGLEKHPWAWNYISESVSTFEQKIALLKARGFTGVFWQEVYDHMVGTRVLPDNSILLTFDDGYLDNWVYVYPILRKYGMKGTIFVSPDFVDRSSAPRYNLDDVAAGDCSADELQVAGFLNWAEMRAMEKSGLIDIQSHAMTHTWYFNGPRIEDFHSPHDVTPYPWLFWNARPDRKSFYLNEDQQEFVPWGFPILEHGKSLETRRFFPDEDAILLFTRFVSERGGREFFSIPAWRNQLDSLRLESFPNGEIPGSYEPDGLMKDRLQNELCRSKELIELNLDKTVDFICWPGGANDEQVQKIARDAGFKSWTLSSRDEGSKRNRPGADPVSIKRIGTSNEVRVRGRTYGSAGANWQLWHVLAHQGSSSHSFLIKVYKSLALLGGMLGRH